MRALSVEEVSSVAGGFCGGSLGNIVCGVIGNVIVEVAKRVYVKAKADDGLEGADVTGYGALADAGISA